MDAFAAVKAGNLALLKEVLEKSPDSADSRDDKGVSLLLSAKYRMRVDMVEAILSHHGPLDVFEASALGKIDRVKALLDLDAKTIASHSPDGFTPLHLAAFFGQTEIVKVLLDRGADFEALTGNAMKLRPLHSAAAGGSIDAAKLLLEKGADPNARQHGGFTPLMSAASNGSVELVKALLAKGADATVAADNGRLPVDLARSQDYDEVVALLDG
jgi:ankyrin repeat protein